MSYPHLERPYQAENGAFQLLHALLNRQVLKDSSP